MHIISNLCQKSAWGFLGFLAVFFLLACSDPQADAEEFRRLQVQDSLKTEISQTKARIDSLLRVNDSLRQIFDSLGTAQAKP